MDNKDLVRQYVNLGLRLPEHQVNQLSGNELKSYLRVRVISISSGPYGESNELLYYEYLKMDDRERNHLIKSLRVSSIEYCMMTLNWRGGNDDFVIRLVRLRSSEDILGVILSILNNTHSIGSIIYKILEIHGPIFVYNYDMRVIIGAF